jgi:tetratricopeptide (TPR) repeat protein
MTKIISRRFSVALSFPGEKRCFVKDVAENLNNVISKDRVLYDKYLEAEFARPNLDVYLPNLYRSESELVVLFLCQDYKNKRWCRLEWRHIKELISTVEEKRIMLLSFGNPGDLTDLGILSGDGYVDIGSRKPVEIARLILQRHCLNVSTELPSSNQKNKKMDSSSDGQHEEVKIYNHFYGKQRKELLNYFTFDWFLNGPAVAIVQGFPGTGKSQLALAIAANSQRCLDSFEPQYESDTPSLDILIEIAFSLKSEGIYDLTNELEKGSHGNLFNALLRVLRRERILIILDEFQRLLNDSDTLPPKGWRILIEKLNNSNRPAGRLLLISNRFIKNARWSENCIIKELRGLNVTEAAAFLFELLNSKNLSLKIPHERLEEVGCRLGGNPRALKTLVGNLMSESLDDLISLAPDLIKPGDVILDYDLVEEFERELINRTILNIEKSLLKFMRWLAVHRRSFKKEAFTEFFIEEVSAKTLRKQLINRFLLKNLANWYTLHPLAREISVSRLREEKDEWKQAHNLAANYHLRHFKALQLQGTQKLIASYSELRHHLYESGRIDELNLASKKLSTFALSQITKPIQSQVPKNIETLEEHIALISALSDDQRPKGLEYHLALCLKHRNNIDDYHKALYHVRNAAGPHVYYAVWLLYIDLEYSLNGIDAMLKIQKEALRHLGSGSNSFSVYHHCAHILEKDNRLSEAVSILEIGIYTPGITCLSSLISLCVRYMEKAGRYNDAIRILEKAINTPKMPEIVTLYIHGAKLMVKMNRLNDAMMLLKNGINIQGMTNLSSIYLLMAEFMVQDGQDEEAILLLKESISDSRIFDPIKIYRLCAELLVKKHRFEEATALLEGGIETKAIRNPLPLYHYFTEIMEKSGNIEEGIKFLMSAIASPKMKAEPSIYLTCANLLFQSGNLDNAIIVLKRGISVPEMREQGQLYQKYAELIGRQGFLDEAIEILKKRISSGDTHHLASLYHSCSELMVKAGHIEDAINLMKNGIRTPLLTNKTVLYQACAKLLDKAKRTDEGIELLENAIGLPGMTGMVILYQLYAKLMSRVGRKQDAIQLLRKAIFGPKMGNLVSLFQLCVELLIDIGQEEEAILLLKRGIAAYPKDMKLKTIYERANSV